VGLENNITLIVEKSIELQRFYSLNYKVWVGSRVLICQSPEQAVEILAKEQVNLVVSKLKIDNTPCSEIIFNAIKEKGLATKLINIGLKKLNDEVINLPSALDIQPLMKASAKLLNVTPKDMVQLAVPEYFGIDIEYFKYIPRSVTDVFLKQGDKYELALEKLTDFSEEDINKLAGNNEKLYIEKNARLTFVNNLSQELVTQIPEDNLNKDEMIKANEMSQNLISEKLRNFGITKETVELSKRNIKNMVESCRRFPTLGNLVQKMLRNRSSYLYKHSQLLMYVCSHLMDHIDWGNEDQKKKINFVCFFHDIALMNDEQAMIYTEDELKSSKLSDKEKEHVSKHAQIAAEIVHKYPHAPMGSDVIIRQHHGVPHGIGFAENFTANLSPMTIVFILAENFVDTLIREEGNFDLATKINEMRERFSTQRFQKIIDILEGLTL
jgi:hypothetical protein